MRHPLRALALACALAATPACASLQLGETKLENPVAAARTIDQQAYALLNAYAAVIEEATDIVRDPSAPLAFKRALGQAERVATPAAETLQIAVVVYVGARADFEASSGGSPARARTRRRRAHHHGATSKRCDRSCTSTHHRSSRPRPRTTRLTERNPMLNLMLQLQMLLAALSAFLPLVPAEHRARAAEIIDIAAKAFAAGGSIGVNLDDLAIKLAAVRAEVEAMAAAGRAVTGEELDAAMARVRAASAAFRAALETAEASA